MIDQRRGTPLVTSVPAGLSNAFVQDETTTKRWSVFAAKNGFEGVELADVVVKLRIEPRALVGF